MMYNAAQLLQGVIPQAGIRLRCNILGKIPQRLAGEQPAQVYRHQHLYRTTAPAARYFFSLQVQNRLHHGGAQQLRYRHTVFLGLCFQLGGWHHQRGQVQVAIRFRCSTQVVGGRLFAAGLHPARVLLEAILQLLLTGRVQAAQHAISRWDLYSIPAAQVLRQQSL